MAKVETIVRILGEGGDVTLFGRRTGSGWRFMLGSQDDSLVLSGESDESIESSSNWVGSWDEALTLLDRYRWAALYPGEVHPEFAAEVLKAVDARLDEYSKGKRRRWQAVCEGGGDRE